MNMQKCVSDIKYQILSIVLLLGKIHTHSLKGFRGYIKLITLQLYQENYHMKIVTFALDHDAKLSLYDKSLSL